MVIVVLDPLGACSRVCGGLWGSVDGRDVDEEEVSCTGVVEFGHEFRVRGCQGGDRLGSVGGLVGVVDAGDRIGLVIFSTMGRIIDAGAYRR